MNLVSAASHLRIHSINAANLGGRGHEFESQCPAVTRRSPLVRSGGFWLPEGP